MTGIGKGEKEITADRDMPKTNENKEKGEFQRAKLWVFFNWSDLTNLHEITYYWIDDQLVVC